MFKVVMSNPGGELDSRSANDETDALTVLRAMLDELPELADGDVFSIFEEESEDDGE